MENQGNKRGCSTIAEGKAKENVSDAYSSEKAGKAIKKLLERLKNSNQ